MKPIVFVPEPISSLGMDILADQCECIAPWREGRQPAIEEMKSALHASNAVIVRLFRVDGIDIDSAPNLKVIAKHGVGVDNIDCEAATRKRIPVVYTPNANANAVAEHALALILALARDIVPASQALRDGQFGIARFSGVELAGKVLGVVGLGRIGGRVAEMAKLGFDMDVRGYDPMLPAGVYSGPATLTDGFEELLTQADFLTLHLPLTEGTRHMINKRRLGLMKPTCRLINTSRGPVIDESALVDALQEGRIGGAALDVFETEPLPASHPLCSAPNTLLTPHISSSTRDSLDRMATQAAQGVIDVLNGRRPTYLVNPEAYP